MARAKIAPKIKPQRMSVRRSAGIAANAPIRRSTRRDPLGARSAPVPMPCRSGMKSVMPAPSASDDRMPTAIIAGTIHPFTRPRTRAMQSRISRIMRPSETGERRWRGPGAGRATARAATRPIPRSGRFHGRGDNPRASSRRSGAPRGTGPSA